MLETFVRESVLVKAYIGTHTHTQSYWVKFSRHHIFDSYTAN